MKKLFSFFFCLLIVQAAFSQCYTDSITAQYLRKHPRAEKAHDNAIYWWRQQPQPEINYHNGNLGFGSTQPIIYSIPVVVHIDTTDGSTNLTDQEVNDGLSILNAAFAPHGIAFCKKVEYINTELHYGIERFADPSIVDNIDSQLTTLIPFGYFYPKKYINIYVVKNITATGGNPNGYASMPGMAAIDAIVVKHGSWAAGKVLIHEAGHYLGLYHTFEGSCNGGNTASTCSIQGDRCCDTRPASGPAYSCQQQVPARTCNTYHLNIDDDHYNHMAYNTDPCRTHFTADQQSIMWAVLNTSRKELISTGLICSPLSPYFSSNLAGGCDLDTIILSALPINHVRYRWQITDSAGGIVKDTSGAIDTLIWTPTAYGSYSVKLILIDSVSHDTASLLRTNYFIFKNCGDYLKSEQGSWYFGLEAGLKFRQFGTSIDFNPSKRSPNINTSEGTISHSDKNGNLLFYGGGADIYDLNGNLIADTMFRVFGKDYIEMPNSPIYGNQSSSQGGIVIPMLGDTNKYYLFTTGGDNNSHYGLYYSIIDMTLHAGKGDIDINNKNIPVKFPLDSILYSEDSAYVFGEPIAAMPVCDGSYRIYVYNNKNNALGTTHYPNFYRHVAIYKVDASGCHFEGVSDYPTTGSGEMIKISPDGRLLYCAGTFYEINKYTGALKKWKSLLTNNPFNWGCCFSPDSKVFYRTEDDYGNSIISQFDLYSSDTLLSGVEVYKRPVDYYMHIQNGPDGKLYLAAFGSPRLGVINFPNVLSGNGNTNLCGVDENGPSLMSGQAGGTCQTGLPNFINAKLESSYTLDFYHRDSLCQTINYFPNKFCVGSYRWYFGDGGTDTAKFPVHTYSSKGTYTVTLIADGDTAINQIKIGNDAPSILGNIHFFCDTSNIANYSLSNRSPYDTYNWSVTGGRGSVHSDGSFDVKWDSISGAVKCIAISPKTGCKDSSVINVELSAPYLTDSIGTGSKTFHNCPVTISSLIPYSNINYRWFISNDTTTSKIYTEISNLDTSSYTFTPLQRCWIYRVITNGCKTDTSNIVAIDFLDDGLIYVTAYDCNSEEYSLDGNTYSGLSGGYFYETSTDLMTWNYVVGSTPDNTISLGSNPFVYVRRYVNNNGCYNYSNILKLNSLVSILTQPRDTGVCLPNTGILYSITADYGSGNSFLRYQWQVKDSGTTVWFDISGATNSTLNGTEYYGFSNLDFVRCKVGVFCASNSTINFLSTSNEVVLSKNSLSYTISPSSITLDESQKAIFYISSNASSYQWVGHNTNTGYWYNMNNETNDSLIIDSVQECMDSKLFKVNLTDVCGNSLTTSTVQLFVNNNDADLWSHDSPRDDGAEPDTASENDPIHFKFWRSIDLWNKVHKDTSYTWWNYSNYINDKLHENPDYSNSNTSPNYLYVRIFNKGTDSSKAGKLYTYWTVASTGERWDIDWKEALADSVQDVNGIWRKVGGEINKLPISIPSIAPNKDTTIEIAWFPPDPFWYPVLVNGTYKRQETHAICLLSRIETCDSTPYGMTYSEIDTLRYNVKQNNNIVTRNTIIVDGEKTNTPIWIRVANPFTSNIYTHVNLVDDDGDFTSYGKVRIYLDDSLKTWWINGGALMSGVHINDSGVIVMDSAFSIWFNNLRIPPGGVGQIGFEYVRNTEATLTTNRDFNFHVIQYFSNIASDSSGEGGGGGGEPQCTDCDVEIGGGGDVGEEGCPDCVNLGGGSNSIVLVDIHGYPMTLVGGVHMKVHLLASGASFPIFRKPKQGKMSGSSPVRFKWECNLNPNPSTGEDVTVSLTAPTETTARITISDATGKVIFFKSNLAVTSGLNQYTLNTKDIASGM